MQAHFNLLGMSFLALIAVAVPRPLLAQQSDFAQTVAPVLAQNCLACHNARKPEGGLDLESHAALMKGGDSGLAVTSGDPDGSLLLQRILDDDDPMPPEDNAVGARRLSETEVDALRQWIQSGAKAPESQMTKLQWQALPESVHPINSLVASRDGQFVVFGTGNLVRVRDLSVSPSGEGDAGVSGLNDPAVAGALQIQGMIASHLDIVQSVAIDLDSQRLATGGYRTVKIWKRQRGMKQQLGLEQELNQEGVFSPDQHYWATTSGGTLQVVDLQQGQSHRLLQLHKEPIQCHIWLSQQLLLTADRAGQWKTTDVTSWDSQSVAGTVPLVAFATLADQRLAVVTAQGELQEWTMMDGQATMVRGGLATGIQYLERQGDLLTGIAEGNRGIVWNLNLDLLHSLDVGQPIRRFLVDGTSTWGLVQNQDAKVQLIKLDNSQMVVALDQDYRLSNQLALLQEGISRQKQLIDWLNGRLPELQTQWEAEKAATAKVLEVRDKASVEVANRKTQLEAAANQVTEGQQMVTAAEAKVAEAMKELEAMKSQLTEREKARQEAATALEKAEQDLAKREQALASAKDSEDRAARRVPEMEQRSQAEQQRMAEWEAQLQQTQAAAATAVQPTAMAFSPRQTVYLGDQQGRVREFAQDGRPLRDWNTASAPLSIHAGPEATWTISHQGEIQKWENQDRWILERTIGGVEQALLTDRITALSIHPNGKWLAIGSGTASRFGDVKILDIETGNVISDLGQVHSDSVLCLEFSPDGRWLASGAADKVVRIFETQNWTEKVSLEGHTHHVLGLGWRKDGRALGTASADQTLKYWDLETGTQLHTVAGFGKEVTSVQFVGDGAEAVVSCGNAKVYLVNLSNGARVREFSGADAAVLAAAVGHRGQWIWAGGLNGKVWRWNKDSGQLEQP